jgi:hypothetical protein
MLNWKGYMYEWVFWFKKLSCQTLGVGIAKWYNADYGLDDWWFESRQWLAIFIFTTVSRLALGPTQLPIQWVSGALSLGVKRPGREADHSPPYSTKIKNAWSYTSTPQYAFMAWCSVKKHRDNYTYTFTLEKRTTLEGVGFNWRIVLKYRLKK